VALRGQSEVISGPLRGALRGDHAHRLRIKGRGRSADGGLVPQRVTLELALYVEQFELLLRLARESGALGRGRGRVLIELERDGKASHALCPCGSLVRLADSQGGGVDGAVGMVEERLECLRLSCAAVDGEQVLRVWLWAQRRQ